MYLGIRYEYYFISYQMIISIARANLSKVAITPPKQSSPRFGGDLATSKNAVTISLKPFFTMPSKLVIVPRSP
jgi:hypothetical protein